MILIPAAALAAPPAVRPELVTTFPMHVGAGVLVEGGPRLRAATNVGLLPGPYVGGITAAIGWLDPAFTDDQAALVRATVHQSLVWRTEAGWRFVPALGLYAHGAYTFAGLGGSATTEELIEGLSAAEVPDEPRLGNIERDYDATATLHLLGGEIGWDQALWRGLHVRAAFGWSFTVGSRTEIGPAFDPAPVAEQVYATAGEEASRYLDSVFRDYAHPPTVTVSVGWAFGR